MLKQVLLIAIIATCFQGVVAENNMTWCPSKKNTTELNSNCSVQVAALTACAANYTPPAEGANDTNTNTSKMCYEDKASQVADKSGANNATTCAELKTGQTGWNMNSTEGKAVVTCEYSACCDVTPKPEPKAGSKLQFGMVMFLGIMLANLLK